MRSLLFLILICCVISCSKEYTPQPENQSDPYYKDIKPELVWNTQNEHGYIIGDINHVEDKLVFLHNHGILIAFNKEDGSLAWETDISQHEGSFDIRDIEAKLIDGQLFVIDKTYPRFIVLDFSTGNVLDYRSPANTNKELSYSFGYQYIGHEVYFVRYNSSGTHEFYKYDFVNDEGETLIDLDQYEFPYSAIKPSVISEDKSTIYLYVEEKTGYKKYSVLAVDLTNNSIKNIWEESEDRDSRGAGFYTLIDDIIILEKISYRLVGVNVKTGQKVWVHNIANSYTYDLFKHRNELYRITNNLFHFDHVSGELIYESDEFGLKGRDCYSTVPNKDLTTAVSYKENGVIEGVFTLPRLYHVCTIYDLTDGQRLAEWYPFRSREEKREDVKIGAISADPETKDIYVSTNSHLIKYKWPFE